MKHRLYKVNGTYVASDDTGFIWIYSDVTGWFHSWIRDNICNNFTLIGKNFSIK